MHNMHHYSFYSLWLCVRQCHAFASYMPILHQYVKMAAEYDTHNLSAAEFDAAVEEIFDDLRQHYPGINADVYKYDCASILESFLYIKVEYDERGDDPTVNAAGLIGYLIDELTDLLHTEVERFDISFNELADKWNTILRKIYTMFEFPEEGFIEHIDEVEFDGGGQAADDVPMDDPPLRRFRTLSRRDTAKKGFSHIIL
jgi:hypothetical protein